MVTFKEFLIETVYKINKDVDFIYKELFKDVVAAIKTNKHYDDIIKIVNQKKKLKINSQYLKNKKSIEAHNRRPINIVYGSDNSYHPHSNLVNVSINGSALSAIAALGTYDDAVIALGSQSANFKTEFTMERIKGSIHHEIAHWIDDALYDRIFNMIGDNNTRRVYQGYYNVALTDYELQAQIHSIVQLKRKHIKKWDYMTISDMIALNASLQLINDSLSTKDRTIWLKLLLKRMHRERLLGKKMR